MKTIGNSLTATLMAVVLVFAQGALGAVTVNVDRNRVSLGDTLRLTITATQDEDISEQALVPLQQDFDIVRRASSSNTNIVNGRVSHSRQVAIDLQPRSEGTLQIPSLHIEQTTTPALTVVVGPVTDSPGDGQDVLLEAEVDRDSVYVQGQIILTLRLQQAVSLEGRSLSELKLDKAFVKPLEQHSFQRTIDGRQWLVDEVRYAIFPEQSGTLDIPAQVFAGQVNRGRHGFFDFGGRGEPVRRSSQPVSIKVLPKPASFGAGEWLPARSLTLEETWSTPPEQLRVGESATRTIRIVGEGLQGAQLPPILFTPTEGLKYYPDQPRITEQETTHGLEGIREDSAAVVPTRAGTYLIPEIRIPWWDTQTDQLQYAVLPERTISVAAQEPVQSSVDAPTAAAISMPETVSAAPTALLPLPQGEGGDEVKVWQIVSAVSTFGWLLTLLYLWRKRQPAPLLAATATENAVEKNAFKQLLGACKEGDGIAARASVIAWASVFLPGQAISSLTQIAALFGDEQFKQQMELLDASLYSPGKSGWAGKQLADCAQRLRSEYSRKHSKAANKLQLYPEADKA